MLHRGHGNKTASHRVCIGLGLAPRAMGLLTGSVALVVAGTVAYGATVPGLVAAQQERAPHVAHGGKSNLGGTAGYVWASVLDEVLFGDSGEQGSAVPTEVTLADGSKVTISTKIVNQLGATTITKLVDHAEQAKQGAQGGNAQGSSSSAGSSSTGSGSGAADNAGSTGTPGSGADAGSGSGSTAEDDAPARPTEAEEASIHSWLASKYSQIDGYVSRCNEAVATYRATGDGSSCDAIANEIFFVRAEFGRQTIPTASVWYTSFAKLWGAYTNLDIWVGHYGDDDNALNSFNANIAAVAL